VGDEGFLQLLGNVVAYSTLFLLGVFPIVFIDFAGDLFPEDYIFNI